MPTLSHRVAYVGRRAKDPWLDVVEVYASKMRRSRALELVMLREGDVVRERQALLQAPRSEEQTIALDERGKLLTTEQWCKHFDTLSARGLRSVCWLIGGAEGLGDEVRAKSDALWALSPLTLPHRGALALLLEQLYRCGQIAQGTAYHRAG